MSQWTNYLEVQSALRIWKLELQDFKTSELKKKGTFYSWKPSATEYSPVLNDVIFYEIFYSVKLIWHCKIIV